MKNVIKDHLISSAIFILIVGLTVIGIWHLALNSVDLIYRLLQITNTPKYIEFNLATFIAGLLFLTAAVGLLVLLTKRMLILEHFIISWLLNVFLVTVISVFLVILVYTPLLDYGMIRIAVPRFCSMPQFDQLLERAVSYSSQTDPNLKNQRYMSVCNFKDKPFGLIFPDQDPSIKKVPND